MVPDDTRETGRLTDRPRFGGLWLCRRTSPDSDGISFRGALLFAETSNRNYMIRFTHSDRDTGGMTILFAYDYEVFPTLIRQHPLNYSEEITFDVPWSSEADGSLILHFDDRQDRYVPTTWEQVLDLGFESGYVQRALDEVKEAGWQIDLKSRFPEFRENQ